MSSSLQVNDRRWREIKGMLPELDGAEVKVGIQSDAGATDEGTPLAAIGFWNEFGTRGGAAGGGWGGPVPARPFIRDTADEKRAAWMRVADQAINAALRGTATLERGFTILGALVERDIKQAFVSGGWTPNSPVTVALKGSTTPLIDTGALRGAIRYEVKI
ncbi:MAG: hypothetical protein KJP02_11890 [Octadecabacter sp.]|nr:hypothetical protein [Octadecabacter sp.]